MERNGKERKGKEKRKGMERFGISFDSRLKLEKVHSTNALGSLG